MGLSLFAFAMSSFSTPDAPLPPPPENEPPLASHTFLRLKKKLERQVGQAIGDYRMIEEGDTVLVCVSGGKDSFSLLSILMALQARAPVAFRIVAMNLDQKQPGFPAEVLPAYFEKIGVEYRIVTENTYGIVKQKIPEGKTTCSLCSRLRRGIIYRTATEVGATKIALGHHRDDLIETLFLNLFFGGRLKAMPPKLVTDKKEHVVIRPLLYCTEREIERFARAMRFPIIPCSLCGSQEHAQRQQIKRMLEGWSAQHPSRIASIATALSNVVPSHLADRRLFPFETLSTDPAHSPFFGEEEEDTLFDPVAFEGVLHPATPEKTAEGPLKPHSFSIPVVRGLAAS
jgi:tRNA 2-thiocytidine biosynthesis protein TtcA